MKKLSWFLLVLVLSVFMVACSDSDTETGTEDDSSKTEGNSTGTESDEGSSLSGEITVWAHPFTDGTTGEAEMFEKIIANFESETGVKVNFEQIPWANRDQKILTALAAGQGPDVFYVIPDQMPQYAEQGLIAPITEYFTEEDLSAFVPSAFEATTWKDELYGIPVLQTAESFFYNVDVINAIGEDPTKLPTTWDEFKVWAEKAKAAGYYAFSYPGGGSLNNTLYPFLWQAGGNVIDEDNNILINNEAGVKTFTFIKEMYDNGWIPADSISSIDQSATYLSGKILALNGSGVSITTITNEADFDFVIGEPLTETEKATYGTVGMFVTSAISKNMDGAAAFIKHFTNAENQREFNTVTQYIPTVEEAKDIYDSQPKLAQLAGYTDYAKPGVINPNGRTIMPLVQAEIQAMLEGKQTPQEAADKSAAAIENMLQTQ